MNPEIKAEWQAALRSDEYPQGNGWLRDSKGNYCCLGVLCDLYRKKTGKGEWVKDGLLGPWRFAVDQFDQNSAFLPIAVRNWAGIDYANPSVVSNPKNGDRNTLSYLNDNNTPFVEIADIIDSL